MSKKWIWGALASVVTSAAMAVQPVGPYFGVLAGTTEFSIDVPADDSEDAGRLGWNGDRLTWGGFAGWQFIPYLGVEVGIQGTRKFAESFTDEDGIKYSTSYKLSNVNASAIGTLPLGDTWSLYGRIGVARTQLRYRDVESVPAMGGELTYIETEKGHETNLVYGVGIAAAFENARLRLEYTRFKYDRVDLAEELELDAPFDVKLKAKVLSLGVAWYLPFGR